MMGEADGSLVRYRLRRRNVLFVQEKDKNKVMEPLGEDEIFSKLGVDELFAIYQRIDDWEDKHSFSAVCKTFLKVACFRGLEYLSTEFPNLLYEILTPSPKLLKFHSQQPLSNQHMKLVAKSFPNLECLDISLEWYFNDKEGQLDFDDVGLCAIADACLHLVTVALRRRLGVKDIGISSLIRTCKNLKELHLYGCVNVTDKSLKIIAQATSLEELYLGGCYLITDVGLHYLANEDLKRLNALNLCQCSRITDKGIIQLKKLVNLSFLNLRECGANITDDGVVALCELPCISELHLSYLFNLTDKSLLEIGSKCLNLEHIYLHGCNRITIAGLRAFSGHQHIRILGLFKCYTFSWKDVKSIAVTIPDLLWLGVSRRIKKSMLKLKRGDNFLRTNIGHYCKIVFFIRDFIKFLLNC